MQIKSPASKIAKETTISFIGMGFGDTVRYLFTAILARFAGVEFLGIYSLATSITRIGEVFSRAGLHSGVMRFVSRLNKKEDVDEIRQVIQSGLVLGLFFSLCVMVILLAVSDWLAYDLFKGTELLKNVIVISAFSLPFATIMVISAFASQGFKRLKYKVTIINIISPLVMLICVLYSLIFLNKESAIKYPLLISSIIGSIVGVYFLRKLIGLKVNKIFKGTIDSELMKFSYPLMFITVLGTIMHWMDIMMIGYFTDTETVGLYHPASRTAGLLRTIFIAFMGIFSPLMSEYHRKNQMQEMTQLYKLVSRWVLTVSFPLAAIIILYSKKVMLLFGYQYVASANILILLTCAAFFQSWLGNSGSTLSMTGFPRFNLLNSVIVLIINVLLNLTWIPLYGMAGAAYATLASMLILSVLRLVEVKIMVKMQPFSFIMIKPLLSGGISVIILYLIKPFIYSYHTVLTLCLAGVIGFGAYVIILFLLKFNNDDKDILTGIAMIFNTRNKL